MKIGFIGLGNMAKAIVEGMLLKRSITPENIIVHSAHENNYRPYAAENGLQPVSSNVEVAQQADVIILAVSPVLKDTVFAEIKSALSHDKIVVSLLTGVSIAEIEAVIDVEVSLVRVMPNLNVRIGVGITAIAANQAAEASAKKTVQTIFEQIGEVIVLPEADFSTFVALAGSAPAFAYLFMEALAHAGVKYGLSKTQSLKIVAQMVSGSAQMIQQTNDAPWNLIDQVASPGGSTIAGVLALQEAGFETALTKAVDATVKKDLEQ